MATRVAAVKRRRAGGTTEVDLLTVYDSVDIAEVASHVRALGGVWVGNIEEGLRDFDIVIHLPYTPGGNTPSAPCEEHSGGEVFSAE